MANNNFHQMDESLCSPSDTSDVFAPSNRNSARTGRNNEMRVRSPPPISRRHSRMYRPDVISSYIDYHHRSPLLHPRKSIDRDTNRYESRPPMRGKYPSRPVPRVPSFGQRSGRPGSFMSSIISPRSHTAIPSPRMPPQARRNSVLNEKHNLPPYDATYDRLVDNDGNDELEEMMRTRRLRRIIKYAAYGVVSVLIVLACSLVGYFLAPRSPAIALHAVDSPDNTSAKFKLQGTKMQFHIELTYRVENDNYFDMVIDDISTAVFWPDTNFALGGGRLSGIKVPPRRVAEIVMPITIRYDVKRGPPPILLGMVESCGLHDTGVGEMNLEAEVQADFRTKMKQSSVQSGRQSISVRCPVRRMATLQVDDGTSGNIGDIVRTLNA
ncbi:hypothetical protein GGI25_000925 [Coemansia spiralis]|uniref:Late embryogenesis abundant protein LEA-2 subgroup domain-containing protein n=2 Tax=Coemansia TaxID=4863 RepID=A0A9W8GBN8_9FUNG|nr:hypothetical protein BX070DRAFT_220332 [Coemansia spiralis]KAJ1993783.1 hypothetical protein EDC05_001943 [Coemansia umbellata]KAJ2623159.1 hypothetical protein GGI26_002573 [Coemansia sp. RSA 1358]KAJ2680037.1 hypothetical protein GGI25_000925 [Coemansia spiralis]